MADAIRGYKGFDANMACRGHKFEVGKTYTTDKAKACESGFHFCERPQDVWRYYAPAGSRFAVVAGSGQIDRHDEDSKVACTEIEIVREVSLREMIDLCIADTWDKAEKVGGWQATGDRGAASATGYQGAASATGCRGAASATGTRGAASATGDQSIACALGYKCTASGGASSWLVLAERDDNGNIVGMATVRVDGETIKVGVQYGLVGGVVRAVGAEVGDE